MVESGHYFDVFIVRNFFRLFYYLVTNILYSYIFSTLLEMLEKKNTGKRKTPIHK